LNAAASLAQAKGTQVLDIRKYRHDQDMLRSSLINFNSLLIVLAITIVIGCFAEFISLEQQMFRDLGAKIQTLS
jgi:hypothetical protein